jgi:pimeloyl-ACP methyl ester carboxylesterase
MALDVYAEQFGRVEGFSNDAFYTALTWDDVDQAVYPREEVWFYSGENRLQGFIYGGSSTNGLVVISHGLGAAADHYLPMILYFVDKGWRVFAYNNTGVAGSGGDSIRGLTQSVVDLDAALTYIEGNSRFEGVPVMLAGHSWGGFAVCAVLSYNHKVNAVVSFAGFNSPKALFEEWGVASEGDKFYLLAPHFGAIDKQLFREAADLTAIKGINRSNIPVLIVQSADDNLIPVDTTSIYAHRGEITNPFAEFVYFSGEEASGHIDVFCSKEQREYMTGVREDLREHGLSLENSSKLALTQWAEEYGFDKGKANELNQELMERVHTVFMQAR